MSVIRLVLCSFYAVFVTLLSAATLNLSVIGWNHLVELSKPHLDTKLMAIPATFTAFNLTHILLFAIIMVLLATGSKLSSVQAPTQVTYAKKSN
ncbi:hypothetical protein PPL_03742 [Heterostelium album PN500]|uniref:Uncharacterized protein n=1 Tax=Heterostelium pallidum (strain ATCC 26659 / Pp 5 / PN500) TaxID=670386 RepID=D3B6J4_HETP5|nr:hypothetical protein PPL_03742 [Heterostelium album PN500]EFA82964.1 hypothetical protein PPL_03742 [Heterostelium album PN500]|eukprot:XP_020435081.1 hypothetical protein PPL_03742 [Heterostelium album PN500]